MLVTLYEVPLNSIILISSLGYLSFNFSINSSFVYFIKSSPWLLIIVFYSLGFNHRTNIYFFLLSQLKLIKYNYYSDFQQLKGLFLLYYYNRTLFSTSKTLPFLNVNFYYVKLSSLDLIHYKMLNISIKSRLYLLPLLGRSLFQFI